MQLGWFLANEAFLSLYLCMCSHLCGIWSYASGLHLPFSSISPLRECLSLNVVITALGRLDGQPTPGIHLSLPYKAVVTDVICHDQLLLWDSNVDPHACIASVLHIEPASQTEALLIK